MTSTSMPPMAQAMIDTGEKTWLTPLSLLDLLGQFDLDPCCPDEPMPWRTAKRMVSKAEDGLSVDWNHQRVWLNPPYGNEAIPFFKKMVAHSGGGIALVFARTENKLWQEYIFPHAKALVFLRGRLRFCRANGTPGNTSPAPSALVTFDNRDADFLQELTQKGTLRGYFVRVRI